MRYIIADPDEQNCLDLKSILDGYETLDFEGSFGNLETAESKIRGDSPDVAFIRMGKAQLNAFKLAGVIRELNRHTQVIFLSGDVESAVEAFECGADGFLFVPLNREKIVHLLEQNFGKRRPREI